jgi:hypothetical protein
MRGPEELSPPLQAVRDDTPMIAMNVLYMQVLASRMRGRALMSAPTRGDFTSITTRATAEGFSSSARHTRVPTSSTTQGSL